MRFKKKDRVRLITDTEYFPKGSCGTLLICDHSDCRVEFDEPDVDGDFTYWVDYRDIELIPITINGATKISLTRTK